MSTVPYVSFHGTDEIEIRRGPTIDDPLECDLGKLYHTAPRPDLGQVGKLMICMPSYFLQLVGKPVQAFHGAHHAASVDDDGNLFTTIEYQGRSWIWELFNAY